MNPIPEDREMSLYQSLKLKGRLFGRDTGGSIPTEGVMAFCFLIWWYIESFQFFDAFRQKNVNLKAAYTIADMISRQTVTIGPTYIEGLGVVFDYLTSSNKPTSIRVTSVYWDGTDNTYKQVWSYATTAGIPPHTDASINAKAAQIPAMPVGDTVVLVETFMAYEPIFSIGLNAMIYDTFITTRPRFASQVVYDPNV
jgi:hypothetical protein